MYLLDDPDFDEVMEDLRLMFLTRAKPIDVGEWHSQPVDNPLLVFHELQDVVLVFRTPSNPQMLERQIRPSTPWAEDHFRERVSGRPMNPPPSNEYWPYADRGNASHKSEAGTFSHTYPERFWPKYAGDVARLYANTPGEWADRPALDRLPHWGIRSEYGDLDSVVEQLRDNPDTRQAYLPVWFPEDTGGAGGERVPCTLGYHFMIRDGRLSMNYYMRSCEFVRHFKDDLYMAARLLQWVAERLPGVRVGEVKMYISSFHILAGDIPKLKGGFR